MKILIIRFSSIGDIVWATPVVRCCKIQIPDAEIHFATKAAFAPILENNPYIDKLHLLQKNQSLLEYINILKNENFEVVIDLHQKIRSWMIRLVLGKKSYAYSKLSIQRMLYTRFKIHLMPKNTHVVHRYMKAVAPLGVKNDGKGLDFYISEKNQLPINQVLPPIYSNEYAAIVIGASKLTKKLPLHKLVELCQLITLPKVLVGGNNDFQLGLELISNLPESLKNDVVNTCGKYNLQQSAWLVAQANVVYGNDTGLTHIAAAFGKKIYSFWGPTSPLGFEPYMANNVIVENLTLTCRPCSKSGVEVCPKKHFKCMNEIPLKEYIL